MRLLEVSGWSQAEAARRLYLAPSNISQYKNNDNRPSRQVLELFKVLLASEKPQALSAMVLRDEPIAAGDETELWKRRAKTAESELHRLRNGLRLLLDPNSKLDALVEDHIVAEVKSVKRDASKPKS